MHKLKNYPVWWQNCTPETTERAVWHRSCHSSATNKVEIQHARHRYAHALATGHYTSKKRGQKRSTEMDEPDPSTFGSLLPFTQSHTNPLDKEEGPSSVKRTMSSHCTRSGLRMLVKMSKLLWKSHIILHWRHMMHMQSMWNTTNLAGEKMCSTLFQKLQLAKLPKNPF